MTALVSIIIPNYNHALYLPHAIESALTQTYSPCEVIVLDDGSTDHSAEVIARYGGRLRAIFQENRGLALARNAAIHAAHGQYIALLDADDLYEPDFVAACVTALQQDRLAHGVYTGYRFVDQENRPLPQIEQRVIAAEHLHQALIDGNFLVPASVFFQRSCYLEAGLFDEKLSACADWDMWLRLTSHYRTIGVATPLVRYRVVLTSMSSNPQRMLQERLAVLHKHLGPDPLHTEPDAAAPTPIIAPLLQIRRAYAETYLRAVVEYRQIGDAEQAMAYLCQAAKLYPHLLTQRNTLYELALGGQARGVRGDLSRIDALTQDQQLLYTLDCLLAEPALGQEAAVLRKEIYAQSYAVLADLHYAAGRFGMARRYLVQSMALNPRLGAEAHPWQIFFKTLLGARLLKKLRRRSGTIDDRP